MKLWKSECVKYGTLTRILFCLRSSSPTMCQWCSTPTCPTSTRCCRTALRLSPLSAPRPAFLLTQVATPPPPPPSPLLNCNNNKGSLSDHFMMCGSCNRDVPGTARSLLPCLSWRCGPDRPSAQLAVRNTQTHTY